MPYRYTAYFACLVLAGVGIVWAHVEAPNNGKFCNPRLGDHHCKDFYPEWTRFEEASLTRPAWKGFSDFFRISKRKGPSMRVMKRKNPSWRQTKKAEFEKDQSDCSPLKESAQSKFMKHRG